MTLSLPGFELPEREAPERAKVEPAVVDQDVAGLAGKIPALIRIGTSSWSFPGWDGLVWNGHYTESRLARDGLSAYAQHPLLRTVGVDRTFYRPMDTAELEAYRAAAGADFSFVVKAHDYLTTAVFPHHPRYGERSGRPSAVFLDAQYAADQVIGPLKAGLGETLGVVVFQFPPQGGGALGGAQELADRLHRFIGELPAGVAYSIEIRNAGWLTERYVQALADAGASHCLSVHPRMPPLATQARIAAPTFVHGILCRWNLGHGLEYGAALRSYAPFNRLLAPDEATRQWVAKIAVRGVELEYPVHIIVNNKAEGSAPLSIALLAQRIIAIRARRSP